jgi:hypothetical protein
LNQGASERPNSTTPCKINKTTEIKRISLKGQSAGIQDVANEVSFLIYESTMKRHVEVARRNMAGK